MPIFEYECAQCGRIFEELVLAGTERIVCPTCGSADVEKIFSPFAGGKSCGSCAPKGGG